MSVGSPAGARGMAAGRPLRTALLRGTTPTPPPAGRFWAGSRRGAVLNYISRQPRGSRPLRSGSSTRAKHAGSRSPAPPLPTLLSTSPLAPAAVTWPRRPHAAAARSHWPAGAGPNPEAAARGRSLGYAAGGPGRAGPRRREPRPPRRQGRDGPGPGLGLAAAGGRPRP